MSRFRISPRDEVLYRVAADLRTRRTSAISLLKSQASNRNLCAKLCVGGKSDGLLGIKWHETHSEYM
jgi:hypothetical protein